MGDVAIDDLPIAYTAIAANILNEKEVWMNSGKPGSGGFKGSRSEQVGQQNTTRFAGRRCDALGTNLRMIL